MCLPGIDGVTDWDSPYRKYLLEEQCVPDIENQYIVIYQDNGDVYKNVFTVFEDDDYNEVFAKALEFAGSVDTLVFYQECCTEFYNPYTGEPVETPLDAVYCKSYYDQPTQPYQTKKDGFTAVETDELPF